MAVEHEVDTNRISVAVDDLGSGLWSGRVKQVCRRCQLIKAPAQANLALSAGKALICTVQCPQELEARTPLRNVPLSPSPSRPPVAVEELPIRYQLLAYHAALVG
jgi:hypothetical protein